MAKKRTLEELEQRIRALQKEVLERKHADEELRESNRRLQIAYDQSIVYAENLNEEISERKRMEKALRESEEKYSTLVEDSLTGIYIDQDRKIVFSNKRFAEIFGYSRNEVVGMDSWKLVHDEDRALTDEIRIERLKGKQAPPEYEARGLTKDGEIIWVAKRNTRIEYKGKPAILGNIVDITKQKHAEQEREKLVHELQDALAEVRTLSGLLPICASCKKIRDDKGYWRQLEAYIRDHSEAEFSHSICPECKRRIYSELYETH
ncbi:MAG: PAS domain S-box protein [Desulfobacterales bacterium]|nr:MAG: PAS domain S-box protein [Desulfobacterales bacterium]